MRTASVSRVAIRTVLAGAAVTALVTGCSPTKDGTPTTSGPKTVNGEKTVEWNPCTQLSDEALRAARMDPATKDVTTDAPVEPVDARICQWNAVDGPYLVSVSSTIYSLDDLRTNAKLAEFREVRVGTRTGLISREKSDTQKLRCHVSLPIAHGIVEVGAIWRYGEPATKEPCDLAIRHANDLEPYLPK
ncbi:DUF3558 domain-containing protein [Nocardia brasiliensis]|uniref:DUF3558 domain-containing protein n=1 Tax=Nocardia brasiliensis TaxID=37326 RepID=A0A6G9XM21_NOCBR|nr:DUF3558 domain-containing protein [Nocardia brasiliensis]QIS01982.1 DUF3558 domain-containing protein [Nocardia brasiliensis]